MVEFNNHTKHERHQKAKPDSHTRTDNKERGEKRERESEREKAHTKTKISKGEYVDEPTNSVGSETHECFILSKL